MKCSFVLLQYGMLCVVAGCVPSASIDWRNLTGRPLPAGKIAMLPPVVAAGSEDQTLASIFTEQLTLEIQCGGIPAFNDDFAARVTAALPPAVEPCPQPHRCIINWLALSPQQRAQIADGADYTIICQPVVQRYGYYIAYIPPQQVTTYYEGCTLDVADPNTSMEPAQFIPAPCPNEGAAMPGADEPVVIAHPPGWSYRSVMNGWPPLRGHEHREVFGAFGWWADDYDFPYTYYGPVAQIIIDYHLYDARTGELIYYIRASNWSSNNRPTELEDSFVEPVTKAMKQAMGLPEK